MIPKITLYSDNKTVFSVGDKLNTFLVMVVNQALLNLGGNIMKSKAKAPLKVNGYFCGL